MNKKVTKILAQLFPNLLVNLAYKRLSNPSFAKLRKHEQIIIEKAGKTNFNFKTFDIQTYKWGNGEQVIMLIHGWGGHAGNFADLIERLILEKKYTIIAFDAPSHGLSSKGGTTLLDFTELVGILINKFQPTKLISHSFGGVATTYSLSLIPTRKISRYVLFTTPDKFSERIEDIAKRVGVGEENPAKTHSESRKRMEFESRKFQCE